MPVVGDLNCDLGPLGRQPEGTATRLGRSAERNSATSGLDSALEGTNRLEIPQSRSLLACLIRTTPAGSIAILGRSPGQFAAQLATSPEAQRLNQIGRFLHCIAHIWREPQLLIRSAEKPAQGCDRVPVSLIRHVLY